MSHESECPKGWHYTSGITVFIQCKCADIRQYKASARDEMYMKLMTTDYRHLGTSKDTIEAIRFVISVVQKEAYK